MCSNAAAMILADLIARRLQWLDVFRWLAQPLITSFLICPRNFLTQIPHTTSPRDFTKQVRDASGSFTRPQLFAPADSSVGTAIYGERRLRGRIAVHRASQSPLSRLPPLSPLPPRITAPAPNELRPLRA